MSSENREPLTTRLIKALALSTIILFFLVLAVAITGFSAWLNTYKAFTAEERVATVTVSALEGEKNEDPSYTLKYTEIPRNSAFEKIFKDSSEAQDTETISFEMDGDRFMVESEVVILDNWAILFNPGRLIGADTIYKVTRLKGEYSDIDLARKGPYTVYDLNGGTNWFWEWMQLNQEKLPFVKSVYSSAAIELVRDTESTWNVYITEDGLGIEKAD